MPWTPPVRVSARRAGGRAEIVSELRSRHGTALTTAGYGAGYRQEPLRPQRVLRGRRTPRCR